MIQRSGLKLAQAERKDFKVCNQVLRFDVIWSSKVKSFGSKKVFWFVLHIDGENSS